MAPFVATNKTPGVYIEEVQLPGAIAGVGTSTAAFLGPAKRGPINDAKFLTNWTEFLSYFGPAALDDPQGPYIVNPPVYVTHAVRGFFDNGGTSCFFVRVGTGKQAEAVLEDSKNNKTLSIKAKQEGKLEGYAVEVKLVNVTATAIVQNSCKISAKKGATKAAVDKDEAVKLAADKFFFRPGDVLLLEEGDKSDRVTCTGFTVATDDDDKPTGGTITFQESLTNDYTAAGTIRFADLPFGTRRIRLKAITGIEPGTYINIEQGDLKDSGVVQSMEPANQAITLVEGLKNVYGMKTSPPTVKTLEFSLFIKKADATLEKYESLSMNPGHSRYFGNIVNSQVVDIASFDPPSPTPPPGNLPKEGTTKIDNGVADEIDKIQPKDYLEAIRALEKEDEVNILCIPDAAAFKTDSDTQDIQAAMVAHCEKMQDRFAVLDARKDLDPAGIKTQRSGLSSDGGYAALYYPWIKIANPIGPGRLTIPPSGHLAGVYARVDDARGVHKAPANEAMRGVLALERTLSDDEQGPLNEQGVNVIRKFAGSGIRVWGARTIAPRDRIQWRYVNVRRLLLFIEESIQEGTQFAVFEPNELGLWGKVKRQITDFLTRVWRDGALFGATAEQAFRVRVDEELNPPSIRQLGQLIIEVVLFPTTPAEFIVFRIIQQPGGPVVQE
jgi:uncharacterized protein